MIHKYDSQTDELLARGGTFDITGVDAVIHKQFWGFNASDGTVLDTIKGIPLKSTASTWALITAAEVDVSALVVTLKATGLLGGTIYRVPGYIITNIKLTSGTIHGFLTNTQVSS
jgi:hypothetical protein